MTLYHLLFVGFLVGTECFFAVLDVMNLRHAESKIDERRSWLTDELEVESPEQLKDYLRLKTGFSRLQSVIGLGVLLLVLYSGLFSKGVALVAGLGVGLLFEGVLFFVGLAVIVAVASWPFSLFQTFVIEELFDFNETTPRLWVSDQLKGLALTVVFVGIISTVILWLIGQFTTTWWLWGWGFFVAFGLLMQVIYPRVIAPLFNDFDPVEEGELHEAVSDVFDRAGFTCSEIYTMDASRRSGHSNAYFIGFGKTKRVVLFDTLIEQLGLKEVQGVLAHELAHWKKGHVWKGVGRSALRTGVMMGGLYVLVNASPLYEMFGLPAGTVHAGLVLGGLILAPVSQWLSPLDNYLSIRDEREADRFAVSVMDDPDPLADALAGMVGENLGNPFPHPLYAAFHYSHPPIPDRIEQLRKEVDSETPVTSSS